MAEPGMDVQAYFDAWRSGDLDALMAMCSDDVTVWHPLLAEPLRGKARVREHTEAMLAAIRDWDFEEVVPPAVVGRTLTMVVRMKGRVVGPLRLPDGRELRAEGERRIDLLTAAWGAFDAEGKVLSDQALFDTAELARQLGMAPLRLRPGAVQAPGR